MAKSAMERLRQGETVSVNFDGYALRAREDYAYVDGCDCSASISTKEAEDIVATLQAWIRIQKKKEN